MHKLLPSTHNSFDTAYVIESYPYGRLRCKMKVWIETPTKGAGKGRQRIVRCTTNPKKAGEVWNKPHPEQYNDFLVMYIHVDTGHVQTSGFYQNHEIAQFEKFEQMWGDQFDDVQRERFNMLKNECIKYLERSAKYKWTITEKTIVPV